MVVVMMVEINIDVSTNIFAVSKFDLLSLEDG
jgi:hypothetical protein